MLEICLGDSNLLVEETWRDMLVGESHTGTHPGMKSGRMEVAHDNREEMGETRSGPHIGPHSAPLVHIAHEHIRRVARIVHNGRDSSNLAHIVAHSCGGGEVCCSLSHIWQSHHHVDACLRPSVRWIAHTPLLRFFH
jgi:hypothetical protein